MNDTMNDTIDALIQELGLTMSIEYAPAPDVKTCAWKDLRLSYTVKLYRVDSTFWSTGDLPSTRKVHILTTPFSMGIGHIPGYQAYGIVKEFGGTWSRPSLLLDAHVRRICATGQVPAGASGAVRGTPILPNQKDILYSLVLGADAGNYRDFEDWADNLGYNSDSIKDKGVYETCLAIWQALVKAVGTDGLRRLTEAFQDY